MRHIPASDQASTAQMNRYARCIEASKRIRREIDRDVIRSRHFDRSQRFLPNGLSRVDELTFLSPEERRFLTQVQDARFADVIGGLDDADEGARAGSVIAPMMQSASVQ